MKKQELLLVLFCMILGFAGTVLAEPLSESRNFDDVNDANVAMRAFELRIVGKAAEATELLKKAVAANPANGPAQFELARNHFSTTMDTVEQTEGTLKQKQEAMKKKLRLAEKAIEKAIKADAANPRYHYWAGKIGTYITVYDAHFVWTMPAVPVHSIDAIKSYEKAIMLKPDFHLARDELIGLYERLPWYCGGDKHKAEKHKKKLEQMEQESDDDLLVAPPKQMKTCVGIYDSRALVAAYINSAQFNRIMKAKMAEMKKAKSSNNTKKIEELEEWGKTQQAKVHRQGFSTAPVDDILEHIKDDLPQIAKDADVIALVSKWDKKTLKIYKSAKLIDITDLIVAPFNPNEKQLKTIEELKKEKPVPLWKLDIMTKFEKH